ncbi:MAG: hypothetical protein FWG20_05795 [Candidatus Cloacimonetes bacterium]|nr:hypothetical protein [Candidatus Cloacimonadota bacterium]
MNEKQKGTIAEFLKLLNEDDFDIYKPVLDYLLELGYLPHKTKEKKLEFRKFGYTILKIVCESCVKRKTGTEVMISFRFSACKEYSQVFQEAISKRTVAMIKRDEYYKSLEKCCGFCKMPRLYKYLDEKGNTIYRCGLTTKDIWNITALHIPELLNLIKEQDEYFITLKNSNLPSTKLYNDHFRKNK